MPLDAPGLALTLRYKYIVVVVQIAFTWDERKNTANQRKHRVSFHEAQSVFVDERALLIGDPDNSAAEDRFILLGMSATLRTIVVCHCYRVEDELIRIISARKANRAEQKAYRRGRL